MPAFLYQASQCCTGVFQHKPSNSVICCVYSEHKQCQYCNYHQNTAAFATHTIQRYIIEQEQISNYLDEKCSKIERLIKQKEQVIEKLTEYKKSLIYECVTGKIEVRER